MAKLKLLDYILYIFALTVALFLLLSPSKGGKANTISIQTENKKYIYSLKNDRKLSIQGEQGVTEIEIKNGQAWVCESTCKNKDCIKRGKIDKSGQSIVCLPNKVVITIEGDSEIDAISI